MTFGDCMSLLVTFFVMLIAFTDMQSEKLLEVVGAFKGALGIVEQIPHPADELLPSPEVTGMSELRQWLSANELSAMLPGAERATKRFGHPKVGDSGGDIIVRMLNEGLAFIIHATPLFEDGGAQLLTGNDELFRQIGGFLFNIDNEVRVFGVVPDTAQVSGDNFSTPWGLGIERAISVQKALMAAAGVEQKRFAVGSRINRIGYANNDKDLPAERIEIVVIGKRALKELSAEEVVIKDKWR